jgi:eukaryotic-like serine/threonine-protein kinase
MSMLRLNDYLAGRFRIDARIAEGGMATVYRGFDQKLDRTIAIKVLRRDAIDAIARF